MSGAQKYGDLTVRFVDQIRKAIGILEEAGRSEAHPRHFIGQAIAEFGGSYGGPAADPQQMTLLGIRCSCTGGPANLVRAWIAKARTALPEGGAA